MDAITKLFCNPDEYWLNEDNKIDCLYKNIPSQTKADARKNFKVSYDEIIIFIRDTSFWNNRNQGLVITNYAIYCIPDNDKPDNIIVLSWNKMREVIYKECCLYFFGYEDEDDRKGIHISYFVKSDEERTQNMVGNRLAGLFTSIANLFEPPRTINDEIDEIYSLMNEEKYEQALQSALDAYAKHNLLIFCFQIVVIYTNFLSNRDLGLRYCDEGLKKADVGSGEYVYFLYYKYSILFNKDNNVIEARKLALLTHKYAKDEKDIITDKSIKVDSEQDFLIYEKEFSNKFLQLPYNERKILMPVVDYTDLQQNCISVLRISSLPKQIEFPLGHPKANQLYIGHPYINEKYILFENYQLILIEDKVREFCHIVQCLGATEISIKTVNCFENNKVSDKNENIRMEVETTSISGDINVKDKRRKSLAEEISQSISLYQTFTPKKKPYLPEQTVWFQHEPSWQRLYQQRIDGNLIQHEERIETRKSQLVDNKELTDVRGELETLFYNAQINWNSTLDENFAQKENAILSINVKFAPIDKIDDNSIVSIEKHTLLQEYDKQSYSNNEMKYIEYLKDLLDDLEISNRERRLLERLRVHLQISSDRAKEIEDLIFHTFSKEEHEYFDLFQEYIAMGEIGEIKRKRLDLFASALGISKKRQFEIENYCGKIDKA